jgi:glycosyltransferase involved in cell wall biosynthesis
MSEAKMDSHQMDFGWSVYEPPKVGVVITHYNYSEWVEGAIDSVLSQDYPHYELIVVDDCSDYSHADSLKNILSRKANTVKFIQNNSNIGQTPSFFVGVNNIEAPFYCLLDPDDRYLPNFLSEMVYLNPYIYVPMAACDQMFMSGSQQLTGLYRSRPMASDDEGGSGNQIEVDAPVSYTIRYVGWKVHHWPWTATSGMMFRRDALRLLQPRHPLPTKGCADSFLAQGSRFLGGTIVYDKHLVFRGVHTKNDYLGGSVLSSKQDNKNDGFSGMTQKLAAHALVSIIDNGGLDVFPKKHFRKIITQEFSAPAAMKLNKAVLSDYNVLRRHDLLRGLLRTLKGGRGFKVKRKHLSSLGSNELGSD